jgi:ribosome biogenesis GTPase / thiamine phosphate phosphatase
MKARELGRNSVVVGDHVALAGDTSGSTGSLARIVRVEERTSELRRSPDDTDPAERVVVANAQQMLIVCALADPDPKTRFIDRCLVAAYDAGLEPLLVLTKSDLASPLEIQAFYAPLGLPIVTTQQPLPRATLSQLRKALTGKISVCIGQSGVGKSTLVNALVPDAGRATGRVNAVTGKGRHTSSSAIAFPLPGDGGWLIDTPGIRGFGLGHISPQRVVAAFGDLAEGTAGCPPGCDHLSAACALDEWAARQGSQAVARLDSLRRLLRSREASDGHDLADDQETADRLDLIDSQAADSRRAADGRALTDGPEAPDSWDRASNGDAEAASTEAGAGNGDAEAEGTEAGAKAEHPGG